MVSFNWSAPLCRCLRQRQIIDILPCPNINDSIRESLDCYQTLSLALNEYVIESPAIAGDNTVSNVFPSIQESSSGDISLEYQSIDIGDDIDIPVMDEPILSKASQSYTNSRLYDGIGYFEDVVSDESLNVKDFLPISDYIFSVDFSLDIELDHEFINNHSRLREEPAFLDDTLDTFQRMPKIAELNVGSIDFNLNAPYSFAYVFGLDKNQDSPASDLFGIHVAMNEGSCDDIDTFEEVAFQQCLPKIALENALSNIEPQLAMLETDKPFSEGIMLNSENYYRALKRIFVKLQFYNPAAPELFDCPDLPSDRRKSVDIAEQLQLHPIPVEFNMKSILADRNFISRTSQLVLNRIVLELKALLPKYAVPYYNRSEKISEAFDNESSDRFLAPLIQVVDHASPSAVTCITPSLMSPSSIVEAHGSVTVSPKSLTNSVLTSKPKRKTKKPKKHTLDDFIALTTISKTIAIMATKPSKIKEMNIAPSTAILDAVDLFRYATSACLENLQIANYLQHNEALFDVSTESAKKLYKRVISRLRQCDQNDPKQFAELCDIVQNALAFATLRRLVDVLIHSGITLCLKQLCFELHRPDLRSVLRLSLNSHWAEIFQELHFRIEMLFQEVCHGNIGDHPKIDILLQQIEPGTVVIVNNRALVPILLLSISTKELHLKLFAYDKQLDYENEIDVLLSHWEEIYCDNKFPWANFRKLIFYEGEIAGRGEYLTELIEEGRISCILFNVEEKQYESHANSPSSEKYLDSKPAIRCIVASAGIAEQNLNICEGLLAKLNDIEIVWRDRNIPDTSFITGPSSIVILTAIPGTEQAQSFITSISELYVQYRKVTLIVIHDADSVIQLDVVQAQMWLITGLASSRIGFTCQIVFATTLEQVITTLCRDISSQAPMYDVAVAPSEQELFLAEYPSINPAAASQLTRRGHSLAQLFSASLTGLKAWFPDLNPISIELFYSLNQAETEQPPLAVFRGKSSPSSLPAVRTLTSGGCRRTPEQSMAGSKRRKLPSNNYTLEDYWGPTTKRSSSTIRT